MSARIARRRARANSLRAASPGARWRQRHAARDSEAVTTLSPARLHQLRSVFGAEVPKDLGLALGLLETSPAAPASPLERAALREAVLALAGQHLDDAALGAKLIDPGAPTTTGARPLPAGFSLRLQEALRAKGATSLRGAVPLAEAERLFQGAASADIPWSFVADGCFFRAHTVAKMLEDQGVMSEKLWAITKGGDLIIDKDKSRNGYSVVVNHVATCVHVERPDGTRARMVIDPSVADRLLTEDEWLANMRSATGTGIEALVMPRFMMMLWERERPPSTWNASELDEAKAWHAGGWRESEKGYQEMGYFDDPLKCMAGG